MLLTLMLSACSSSVKYNEEPYVIQPPNDPHSYLVTYNGSEIFYGHESSFSLPFLEVIPIIGPYIGGKIIQFRSGAVRPVLIPQYKEKTYANPRTSGCVPLGHQPFRMQPNQLQGRGVRGW